LASSALVARVRRDADPAAVRHRSGDPNRDMSPPAGLEPNAACGYPMEAL